jgi:hypothetical protein
MIAPPLSLRAAVLIKRHLKVAFSALSLTESAGGRAHFEPVEKAGMELEQ